MRIPKIRGPQSHEFHDSSLIDISISPHLDSITIVLSTPDEHHTQHLWQIKFTGVLRLEFEVPTDGTEWTWTSDDEPLEIYDIYMDNSSSERSRWVNHLKTLGVKAEVAQRIFHIVLASSFVRGWGERAYLHGIHIICRGVTVEPAPAKYKGREYSRPWIPGGNEE